VLCAVPPCAALTNQCQANPALCPAVWFLQVTSVVVAAGGAMPNTSVYVGSDSTSVFANRLVAVSAMRLHGQGVAVGSRSGESMPGVS